MLEIHATPLMWATILLLLLLCLWWFIVEWVFNGPASDNCTTTKTNNKTPIQQSSNTKTDSGINSSSANVGAILTTESTASANTPGDKTNSFRTANTDETLGVTDNHKNPGLNNLGFNNPGFNKSPGSNPKQSAQARMQADKHAAMQASKQTPEQTTRQTDTNSPDIESRQQSSQPNASVPGDQRHAENSKNNTQNKLADTSLIPPPVDTNQSHSTTAHPNLHATQSANSEPQASNSNTRATNKISHKIATKLTNDEENKPATPQINNPRSTTEATQIDEITPQPSTGTKYQTAAKARHPSSRSEASLQVPTPAAHKTRNDKTELKKPALNQNKPAHNPTSQQALNKTAEPASSTIQKTHENSKQPLRIASVRTKEPTVPATSKESRSNHGNNTSSKTIPFKKHQNPGSQNPSSQNPGSQKPGTHRKQSSIEVAVAQQISELQPQLSQAPIAKHLEENVNTKPDSVPATASNLAEAGSRSGSLFVKPADENPAVDGDAALRAQLASSERRIKSLQSTLNSVQNNLSDMTTPATQTPQQHTRPTLLSKVRVLDHPKT